MTSPRLPGFLQPPAQRLAWIMLATGLIYAAMLAFYGPDAHQHGRVARELFIWPVVIALLFLYAAGYQALKAAGRFPLHALIASAGLIALIATAIVPFHSTDAYGYVNRGWQQAAYHVNPYVWTVDQLPGWERDPMFVNHWVNNPCPYGFLFALLAKWLCYAGGGHPAVTMALFKGLNLITHLAIGLMIWLAARGARPQDDAHPERLAYLYLMCPLILLHHLANGHNDILMAGLLTLGALALIRGWHLLALPALAAAALIKYAAALAIPFALMAILRQTGWRGLLKSALLAGVTALLIASPYAMDLAHFQWGELGSNASISHNSPHAAIMTIYKAVATLAPPLKSAQTTMGLALKLLLAAAFAGFYFWRLSTAWKTLRGQSAPQAGLTFARESLLTMAVAVALASAKFYAWYLGMFLPLALLLPARDELRRFMLAFAGAQLFGLTFLGQAHLLNFLLLSAAPMGVFLWRRRRRREARAAV